MEEILESPLIADLVAEEQRKHLERRGQRLGEPSKLQASSPVLSELRLKEKQLQERERALRAREDSLEREWCSGPRELAAHAMGEVPLGSQQRRLDVRASLIGTLFLSGGGTGC